MEKRDSQGKTSTKRGWIVTFAGMSINLALGILYSWSVISKGVPADWNWTESDKSWPYALACLVFSIVMVPAGRMQDRIGPRVVASIGGILVGLGFIIASQTTSPLGYMIGFGLLGGAGIGFGYASATPPAVKWFSSAKTGLISGIVVAGFGLSSVYAAPLTTWLIAGWGLNNSVMILGIAFLIIVVALAQLMKAPPKGYVPAGQAAVPAETAGSIKREFSPKEMLSTGQFYMLWFMFACGAGAGLMIISKLAAIADKQVGIALGFILVAVLAVGNGAGRIVAGIVSDKIGRKATMLVCFVFQALLIVLLAQATSTNLLGNSITMAIISALIGANYGANLSLFPSITKDFYGLKNFGSNYGLVFTAWGVGGFMLAYLAGKMYDLYQTFDIAYYGASLLLITAALMTPFVKAPNHVIEEATIKSAVETCA